MNARLAIPLLSAMLMVATLGCRHFYQGRQLAMTETQRQQLLAEVFAPEELGIHVVEHADRQSLRWKEIARPEHPVTVPLLPTGSSHSTQPIVAARLNDLREVAMVVDTGAPLTLVSVQAALDSHVRVLQPERVKNYFRGLGGNEQTYFAMTRQVSLGPELAFRNMMIAIRAETYERRLVGLLPSTRWEGSALGLSTLSHFAFFTLDYPQKEATFSYADFFPGPTAAHAYKIPFKMDTTQIRVPVRLGGPAAEEQVAILDTGNDATIMMSSNLVNRMGWQDLAAKGKKSLFVGLGGELVLRNFRIPQLRLGDLVMTNVPAVCGPDEFGLMLGSHFLHHYRTTLDFRRKHLWLETDKDTPPKW